MQTVYLPLHCAQRGRWSILGGADASRVIHLRNWHRSALRKCRVHERAAPGTLLPFFQFA